MPRRRRPQTTKVPEIGELSLADVTERIANGISVRKEAQDVLEEEIVDMETFLINKKYLAQDGVIRPRVCEALCHLDEGHVREGILLLGKGSGKSYAGACLLARGAYILLCHKNPQRHFGLAPGDPIYLINIATNKDQARNIVFASIISKLQYSGWFRGVDRLSGTDYRQYIPLADEVRFNKNVTAFCGNSRAFSLLGYPIFYGVLDELAFFQDSEDHSNAEECWSAIKGSCLTRFKDFYKLVGITSAGWVGDFATQQYKYCDKWDKGYALQAATWEMNPNVTKEDFAQEFAKNETKARRDYAAVPSHTIAGFFTEKEVQKIRENAAKDKPNPWIDEDKLEPWFKCENPGGEYFLHIDLAQKKDACGFGMCHTTGTIEIGEEVLPTAEIDLWGRMVAPPGGEIKFSNVRKLIYAIRDRGFRNLKVSFDRWQSIDSRQILEGKGFDVSILSLDTDSGPAETTKDAMLTGRLIYPYDEVFLEEASQLQQIKGRKVDHPTKGSKDQWDGICGASFRCLAVNSRRTVFTALDDD